MLTQIIISGVAWYPGARNNLAPPSTKTTAFEVKIGAKEAKAEYLLQVFMYLYFLRGINRI